MSTPCGESVNRVIENFQEAVGDEDRVTTNEW